MFQSLCIEFPCSFAWGQGWLEMLSQLALMILSMLDAFFSDTLAGLIGRDKLCKTLVFLPDVKCIL
jgi:hypothetical protein